jgi:hypothetical protein
MRKAITFSECEHDGDVNNYKQDLIDSGATIIEVNPDFDSEEVTIVIDYEKDFIDKFKETNSYDFAE